MLADAGTSTRTLLDASMTGSTGAARIGREAVEGRAGEGGREFTRMLDGFFGPAQGVQTTQAGIRSSTAGARSAAYDAAYATPIDYSARAGLRLESLWRRVPESVRARASRLMQVQGDACTQMIMNELLQEERGERVPLRRFGGGGADGVMTVPRESGS